MLRCHVPDASLSHEGGTKSDDVEISVVLEVVLSIVESLSVMNYNKRRCRYFSCFSVRTWT